MAACVVVLPASAGTSRPADLARAVIVEWTAGSPEVAWKTLHPAHQRVVSQRKFAYCVRGGRGEKIYPTRVAIASSRKVEIDRPEIAQHMGWTVRLVVRRHAGRQWLISDWRLQVVRTHRGLRWLLDPSSFEQYRRFRHEPKTCPE